MDIYSFINSRDMEQYLRNIHYECNALEAAYLVWRSRKVSLEEKIAAWEEIINTYEDHMWNVQEMRPLIPSVHEFLRSYIALKKRLLSRFYADDGGVYFYHHRGENGCGLVDDRFLYSRFDECRKQLKKELSVYRDRSTRTSFVEKRWVDVPHQRVQVQLTPSLQVMMIRGWDMTDAEKAVDRVWGSLWFMFPTPFKRGDVLTPCFAESADCTMVLDYICTWDTEDMIQNGMDLSQQFVREADGRVAWRREYGCFEDMMAVGYVVRDDRLSCEGYGNYLDMEYYRGEYEEERQLLDILRRYRQGKLDVAGFFSECERVRCEEQALTWATICCHETSEGFDGFWWNSVLCEEC